MDTSVELQPQGTRRNAVTDFYLYSLFNIISFAFLAGNMMTLYALRFQASTVAIGLISSAYQANLLFSLLGRRVVARLGAVRAFGYAWLIRYALMVPVILVLLPGIRSRTSLVLTVITVCAYAFNIAKGVGIAGTRPIVGEIAPHGRLGKVISTNHLITNLGGVVTGLVIGVVLGPQSPIGRYGIIFAFGIAAGLVAAWFILQLPEPAAAAAGFTGKFVDGLRRALLPGPFRRFVVAFCIAGISVAMVHAFLVVFIKRVYGYSDGTVVFFTVAGSVGGTVMALVSRALSDRIGAKPLFFAFASMVVVVCVAVGVVPRLGGVAAFIFPAAIYFLFVMGEFGVFTTTDVYFYQVTAAEHRLDLGIVAGLARGAAGLLGSFVGGIVLSALQGGRPPDARGPFTIYFAISGAIMAVALVQITRLAPRPRVGMIPPK